MACVYQWYFYHSLTNGHSNYLLNFHHVWTWTLGKTLKLYWLCLSEKSFYKYLRCYAIPFPIAFAGSIFNANNEAGTHTDLCKVFLSIQGPNSYHPPPPPVYPDASLATGPHALVRFYHNCSTSINYIKLRRKCKRWNVQWENQKRHTRICVL